MNNWSIKNKALNIMKGALAGAEDNLYRANMQFGKMTSKELEQEYGQSGRTCGEILEKYQSEVAEMKRCVAWVESTI
jgi:hypothetical protein